MTALVRAYLVAVLAAFLGFVALGFGAPEQFARFLGITLSDTTALADFRATYGGLSAGISLVLALGLARPAWTPSALLLGAVTSAGLFAGRLVTLASHGSAGAYIYGSMAMELFGAAAGLVLLRALAPTTGVARA